MATRQMRWASPAPILPATRSTEPTRCECEAETQSLRASVVGRSNRHKSASGHLTSPCEWFDATEQGTPR